MITLWKDSGCMSMKIKDIRKVMKLTMLWLYVIFLAPLFLYHLPQTVSEWVLIFLTPILPSMISGIVIPIIITDIIVEEE